MQAKKKQAFLSSSPNVLPRLKFALWNNKQANFIKSRLFLFRNLQHLILVPRLFGHAGAHALKLGMLSYLASEYSRLSLLLAARDVWRESDEERQAVFAGYISSKIDEYPDAILRNQKRSFSCASQREGGTPERMIEGFFWDWNFIFRDFFG